MKIESILYFYVVFYILSADTYIVVPWIAPITILNYMLIGLVLLKPSIFRLDGSSKRVRNSLFIFILYLFINNIFLNDLSLAISRLITSIPVPFIFTVFLKAKNNLRVLVVYAVVYLVYNGIFSLLQYLGYYVTAGQILAQLPFIGVSREVTEEFMSQGFRASGATSSTVGLACNIGVIGLFLWYLPLRKYFSSIKQKLLLVLTIVMAFMTQTRSLLVSAPVSVGMAELWYSKKSLKRVFQVALALVVFVGVVYILMPYLKQQFPRLFLGLDVDYSAIHRIQANVFGIVGTFQLSPLIGLPIDEALNGMIHGYRTVGLFIGDYFIDEVTYHNQPAFYFRHYGLIGLLLFLWVIWCIIKYVNEEIGEEWVKRFLMAVVTFYFLYTLTHNNKILSDYYLWMFLSIRTGSKVFGGKYGRG